MEHDHLWTSLHQQNVPNVYTRILARLYANQTANIVTDKVSKSFRIGRGTKQGDPISPKLFNAVLERAFGRAKERWRHKNYGVQMTGGQEERITNLRFADDVLLIATTREHLHNMIGDLVECTEEVGLEMHLGKRRSWLMRLPMKQTDRERMDAGPLQSYLGNLTGASDA